MRSASRPAQFAFAFGIFLGAYQPTVREQGEQVSTGALLVPSRATFPHVENAMQMHCGTLDCHGQPGRDLRLYGLRGMRLSPRDNPLANVTTSAEYDASYASLIGLEPEALSSVVASRAADPDQLTMIRKARGLEKHKGGKLMTLGDPLYRCMVAWLGGGVDDGACDAVVNTQRPEAPP